MERSYKLHRIRDLAENDQEFVKSLVVAFIEEVPQDAKTLEVAVKNKNFLLAYQVAHKMKPTIDLFEMGVLDALVEIQDWGKFKKSDFDAIPSLNRVLDTVDVVVSEMKEDYNL
ncbi:MAG: Hpt domain-containing protein [Aestuariibaculum sp.]